MKIVLTCEHAVATIPPQWTGAFKDHQALLDSHRGIDFGALALAQYLSDKLPARLIQATVSRLLVDCNRSLFHKNLFSEVSSQLPTKDKSTLLSQYYHPYRKEVEQTIAEWINQGELVYHLSIHSFTPKLNGQIRRGDIGLLYDPKRSHEKVFAQQWICQMRHQNTELKYRKNYPYLGISNGFTSHLRRLHPHDCYIGVEVELNQAIAFNEPQFGVWGSKLPF